MKAQDFVTVVGTPRIVVTDKNGAVKTDFSIPNLVVTAGKGFIASRMLGTSLATMTHMALGTGTTAAAAGNTALQTESARAAFSSTPTAVGAVITYTSTFGAGAATGAITEAGIFNASTGGTMLCRTVFPVVNKGADDTMYITWTVTIQ
jgi:hypothetical protein